MAENFPTLMKTINTQIKKLIKPQEKQAQKENKAHHNQNAEN